MATTLFLRLDQAAFGVILPNAAKGTWSSIAAAGFTTGAKSMGLSAGSGQTSMASGTATTGNIGVAQFCSLPIQGDTILSGTWTVAAAMEMLAGAGWQGAAALFVMEPDGTTIRGTIFNTSTVGASRITLSSELTVLGSPAATTITARDGDFLLLELGYALSTIGSASDEIFTSGTTPITTDNVTTASAQSFLQYSGAISFYASATTLYFRQDLPIIGYAPSGVNGSFGWATSNAAAVGANAKAMSLFPGSGQTSIVWVPTQTIASCIVQYVGPPMPPQTIPAGTWTVGWASKTSTSFTQTHYLGIYVLHANQTLGSFIYISSLLSGAYTTSELTVWATISGGAATLVAGDRILVELGMSSQSSSATDTHYAGGLTAITSNLAATSDAQSFIQAPIPLVLLNAVPFVFGVANMPRQVNFTPVLQYNY